MKKLILFLIAASFCSATGVYGADALDQAIGSLNAKVKTPADQKAVLDAISQQTEVPTKTLQADMQKSNLGYGELLTAESLAMANGKTVANMVALKGKAKTWSDVSKELKIDPTSVIDRLRAAEKTLQAGAKGAKSGKPKAQSAKAPEGEPQKSSNY